MIKKYTEKLFSKAMQAVATPYREAEDLEGKASQPGALSRVI